MPNSPQAGSEMLNNMVASFTASNQIGEEMKKAKKAKNNNDMSSILKAPPKKDDPPADPDAIE